MARHRSAAVAVVNNPSQLLFATEAAHYLKIDTSNIEVVTIPTPGADEEAIYGALISKAGYARVRRLPNAVLTRSGRVACAVDFATRYRGSFVLTPMVNFLPARRLLRDANHAGRALVTDDGAWTVQFAESRAAASSVESRPLIPNAMRVKEPLTFFTLFDDVPGAPGDKFVRNTLSWTRATFGQQQSGAVDIFLGSPLVELGFVSNETYERCVSAMRDILTGTVEYWPHRREDQARVAALCTKLGLIKRQRTLPAEAEVLESGAQVGTIATFPTTSTRSLRRLSDLLCIRLMTVLPQEHQVATRHRASFNSVARTSTLDSDDVVQVL